MYVVETSLLGVDTDDVRFGTPDDVRFDPPDDVCFDPTDNAHFDSTDDVGFGPPDDNSNRRFADEPSPELDFDFAPPSTRDFVFLFAVTASVDPDILPFVDRERFFCFFSFFFFGSVTTFGADIFAPSSGEPASISLLLISFNNSLILQESLFGFSR